MGRNQEREDGRLIINITGSIYRRGMGLAGINHIESIEVEGRQIKRTLVRYGSSVADDMSGEFVFYGELPEEIEGWPFVLKEKYTAEEATGIPIEQNLFAYTTLGKKDSKEFSFSSSSS